jgi:hypothetical protein
VDWIEFFEAHNIPFVEHGPNTSQGNVAIKCCWCGADDDSEHLSVSLEGRGFRCWRQPLHAGKNPAKLVQALLNVSWVEACRIAGSGKTLPSDFMGKIRSKLEKPEPVIRPNNLKLPPEFKKFSYLPSSHPFHHYLAQRGFEITSKNIAEISDRWGIYYSTQGLYKGRIIFTVKSEGRLVGWTGRTIYPTELVRYKTLTDDPEKAKERGEEPAPYPITDYLLFWDLILESNADTIVLCEGPFDAWRINLLGWADGIVATCFFTSALSDQQMNLLYDMLPGFQNKYLMLDQNTYAKAERIRQRLSALGVSIKHLPFGVKDPALIPDKETLDIILNG